MNIERTVEFAHRGLASQNSEVEWPKGLPLPREPNIPKGSRVIEMPNCQHKGIAVDLNGDNYHCVYKTNGYEWTLT